MAVYARFYPSDMLQSCVPDKQKKLKMSEHSHI